MFNIKKKIESKVEEVKTDIKDNIEYSIIGVGAAMLISYTLGYLIGARKNSNTVNINIVERERDFNNFIINK